MEIIIKLYDENGNRCFDLDNARIVDTNNLKAALAYIIGMSYEKTVSKETFNFAPEVGGMLVFDSANSSGMWRIITAIDIISAQLAKKSKYVAESIKSAS